jgi:hypothetical protein
VRGGEGGILGDGAHVAPDRAADLRTHSKWPSGRARIESTAVSGSPSSEVRSSQALADLGERQPLQSGQVKSSQVKSGQVGSSRVKSGQVRSSQALADLGERQQRLAL